MPAGRCLMSRWQSVSRLGGGALLCVVFLLSPGCKSKVTKANFDKIEKGMRLGDVEAILGEGRKQGDGSGVAAQFGVHIPAGGGGGDIYLWESDDGKSITVIFTDGKVALAIPKGL